MRMDSTILTDLRGLLGVEVVRTNIGRAQELLKLTKFRALKRQCQ